MDQDRQIRLAIPPFFLLASLLWGAHLSGRDLSLIFRPETTKELLGLLAATAVVVIPLGFLISSLTVALLTVSFWLARRPSYEAVLSDSTLDRIWHQLGTTHSRNKNLILYAAVTFDHELLPTGIHTWLFRRWNSFNVATNSIIALFIAHGLGRVFSIRQVCAWWISTLVLVGPLLFTSIKAWRETMEMVDFQSYRKQKATQPQKQGT